MQTERGAHKLSNPSNVSSAAFFLSPLILQGEQGPWPASSLSGIFSKQPVDQQPRLASQLSPPKATFLIQILTYFLINYFHLKKYYYLVVPNLTFVHESEQSPGNSEDRVARRAYCPWGCKSATEKQQRS